MQRLSGNPAPKARPATLSAGDERLPGLDMFLNEQSQGMRRIGRGEQLRQRHEHLIEFGQETVDGVPVFAAEPTDRRMRMPVGFDQLARLSRRLCKGMQALSDRRLAQGRQFEQTCRAPHFARLAPHERQRVL